jgi:hypothetical protein
MAMLFDLLRDGAIRPIVVDRLPLSAAREVHEPIDAAAWAAKLFYCHQFPDKRCSVVQSPTRRYGGSAMRKRDRDDAPMECF